MNPEKTNRGAHFGFSDVSEKEKTSLVENVFRSVAARYDLMNDLMSLGAHRLWKDFAVGRSGVRRGQTVLDVAAGSCDLTHRFVERVGHEGRVVAVDVSRPMLQRGKSRMIDAGMIRNVDKPAGMRQNASIFRISILSARYPKGSLLTMAEAARDAATTVATSTLNPLSCI